jgi:hypothetical protein
MASGVDLSSDDDEGSTGTLRGLQNLAMQHNEDVFQGGLWGPAETEESSVEGPSSPLELTPLMEAVCCDCLDSARAMLDGGAGRKASSSSSVVSVDERGGQQGETALMLAAELGAEHMVSLLLDRGADPLLCNASGWTALMLAAMHGHEGVVRQLVHWAGRKQQQTAAADDRVSGKLCAGRTGTPGALVE